MADYQFGLPENDPNYKLTEQKRLEEEQEQERLNRPAPPQPKLFSDAAPLATPEPQPQENAQTVKNQSAIKKGGGQFPVAPPPDELIEAASPEVAPASPAPEFIDALPPTAGKLPFFEPGQPRKTRKLRPPEEDDDDADEELKPARRGTTRPRRSLSNQLNKEKAAEKAKQTIGDAVPIAQYYLAQVQRVLFSPADFFAEMQEESEFTEAAIFMGITLGVCAVMRLLCGDFWALVHLLGGVFIVAAASFFGTYIIKHFEPEQQIDFNTVFAIFAYAQAPKLIAWISMGPLPVGYWISSIYSLYLCCIAFDKIFGMSKMKSGLIVSGVFVAAGVIAWFLHL
ncbi:MAG: YIP1 family protein [Candidatus Obscuribacterales bacterium]|nr:YIP1 family protein [Candidatus Obscuribacterales bacterium]